MFQTLQRGELELLHSPDADIYLQGAHLTRFRDWLFLSEKSNFIDGKAIRGGVPVIFPWFGPNKTDPNLPQHGLVRTAIWQIENVADDALSLVTQADAWRARIQFRFGDDLQLRFETQNLSDSPFEFECALHTYFAVENVENVRIEGLDGATYLDKTRNYARKTQSGAVTLRGETDRVYLNSPGPISIRDEARTIHISGNSGWRSTVVWNPWETLAANMKDLGADEWQRFICVECGAIADDAVTLGAGENYVLDVAIDVANA